MPQGLREVFGRILTVAALAVTGEVAAYTIVPFEEDPGRIVVEIERAYGDRVPLRALPPPYRSLVQTRQGVATLSFRWQYFRSSEQGLFYIRVEDDGAGVAHFEFGGPAPGAGDTIGAAAVLVDAAGTALHTFMARADVSEDGGFADGSRFHRVALALRRPVAWWEQVDAIVFLNMKYYRQQRPVGDAVWMAMENAVRRAAGDTGPLQRGGTR